MQNWQFIWHRILVGLSLRKEIYPVSNEILTFPNSITAFGFLSLFLYQANYLYGFLHNNTGFFPGHIALTLLVVAIISDALDGFFARALGACSHIGEILDPVRDRYLAFVILLQMAAVEKTSFVIFVVGSIILIETFTAIQNWKYSTAVHGVGKLRMGIHMFCSLIFVIQTYQIWTSINIISTETLVVIMLLATVMSSFKYVSLASLPNSK